MTKAGAFVFCILLLTGCGSERFTIYVSPNMSTNAQVPFRMLVRSVDERTFVTETYKQVSEKFYDDSKNTLLAHAVIYPGRYRETTVYLPEEFEGPVAVYFLFTQPGAHWKEFFLPPLPSSMEFELQANTIVSVR